MIDEAKKFEVLRRAIATYGDRPQTDILIEEMSELTKAIIKSRRHGGNYATENIIEEIADVQICIDQLKLIVGKNYRGIGAASDLIDQEYTQKLNRLEGRLDNRERSAKAGCE